MSYQRTRTRLTALVACAVSAVGLGASASAALAGTYAVDACQRPDGVAVGNDGWAPANSGVYTSYGNNCSTDGGLETAFDATVEHASGDKSVWTFNAPVGTAATGITALRSARAGRAQPYGSPTTFIKTSNGILEHCAEPFGCSALDGAVTFKFPAAAQVASGLECVGAPGGRCPAGASFMTVRRVTVTLTDTTAPTFTEPPTGSLASSAALSRVRSLLFSAADEGGGVYRQRVLIDGTAVLAGIVDENGNKCVPYGVGGGFANTVPCKLAASGSASLDTSTLADGAHEVALEVYDATDTNKVSAGPWPITVDNVAPTIADVTVTGTSRQGEALACAASVDGQSPRTTYQWARTAPDGSGAADIGNATRSSYVLTAADVGKKLLCRVAATDGGGTTERTSSPAAGPFADGAVVVGSGAVGGAANGAGATASAIAKDASPTSVANGVAAALAAAAAVKVCATSTVRMSSAVRPLKRAYTTSGTSLAGRLLSSTGTPQGGMSLDLVQTVVRAGTVQRKTIAKARTGTDGTFRVKAGRGPSRALQLVNGECGAVGPILTERVRGALRAKTRTAHVHNRQTARITGRVLGGYVGRGIPLELQVRVGRHWRDVKHVMTNSRGIYRVGYRFERTFVRYTYRFRVVTRAGGAWPYMSAKSRVVKVKVN